MTKSGRIPVPLGRRVRRLCQLLGPPLGFAATLLLTLWLWKREDSQLRIVGEVEALRLEVSSPVAGMLTELPHGHWSPFDAVTAGEIIARLDATPIEASLLTLDRERTQLELQVAAVEQEYRLGERSLLLDRQQDVIRLTFELERLRLEVLDRLTQIAVDRVDLEQQNVLISYNARLRDTGVIPEVDLIDARRRRDMVQQRIGRATQALTESTAQAQRARERLSSLPAIDAPELTNILSPLRAAVAVQEARMQELDIELAALTIRAPVSGIIVDVSRRAGQSVQAGDPILVLAADQGRYVVSFVRQELNWRPTEGEVVMIRERRPDGQSRTAIVQRIGPQVMAVPPHQLEVQGTPEWGLPVQLTLPNELELKPGELVDVYLRLSGRDWEDVQ